MVDKEFGEMTFWHHLSELLSRLRRILYVFIISTIFVMLVPASTDFTSISLSNPFYQTIASSIIRDLQKRFLTESIILIPLTFFAPLEVYFFISIIIGATVSLPFALYELYKFFDPALHKHEKRFALIFTASFIGLFSLGLFLGYMYVVPLTFRTMLLFSDLLNLSPTYDFAEFFSMVGMLLLVCGLIFTFPIFIYLLVKVGVLKTQYLTKNRRYLYGGILIIIIILDPDPGLVTETVTFIPIVLLMEISILISKRIERTRKNNLK